MTERNGQRCCENGYFGQTHDCRKSNPTAPERPKEYAIDWNVKGAIEVRDLRDGLPVAAWEDHVIEHSAYAALEKENAELRAELKQTDERAQAWIVEAARYHAALIRISNTRCAWQLSQDIAREALERKP